MGWVAWYTSPDNPARATVPPARTAGSTMETEFTVDRVEAMPIMSTVPRRRRPAVHLHCPPVDTSAGTQVQLG
jgi:hypothetical protein